MVKFTGRQVRTFVRLRARAKLKRFRRRNPAKGFNSKQVYRYTQMNNVPLANINLTTGSTIFQNPTATVTYIGANNTNVTTDMVFGFIFKLSDCVQSSTFTSLYDQYRIHKIELVIRRTVNDQPAVSASNNLVISPQQIWYVTDFDDNTVSGLNLTALQQYAGVKCKSSMENGDIRIKFRPHIATPAYAGGVFTSFANTQSPWIDSASAGVEHYGVKACIPCPLSTTVAQQSYTVTAKYWLEFKNVR